MLITPFRQLPESPRVHFDARLGGDEADQRYFRNSLQGRVSFRVSSKSFMKITTDGICVNKADINSQGAG
ncbi:MAG TPA: hypothetical protein VGN98_14820, partial [Tianweitania sediminis]|nr:hypothetical protein [Tianweitania sediminis]